VLENSTNTQCSKQVQDFNRIVMLSITHARDTIKLNISLEAQSDLKYAHHFLISCHGHHEYIGDCLHIQKYLLLHGYQFCNSS